MTRIIVHITDDSVGVENQPDEFEIRDYRTGQVELFRQGGWANATLVDDGDLRPYVRHDFVKQRREIEIVDQ